MNKCGYFDLKAKAFKRRMLIKLPTLVPERVHKLDARTLDHVRALISLVESLQEFFPPEPINEPISQVFIIVGFLKLQRTFCGYFFDLS